MTGHRPRASGLVGRFLGSWELALGELVVVALGVMLALWADQAVERRQEAARAVGYLERLQADVSADIRALRFSSDQARSRLALARQLDAWLGDPEAARRPGPHRRSARDGDRDGNRRSPRMSE